MAVSALLAVLVLAACVAAVTALAALAVAATRGGPVAQAPAVARAARRHEAVVSLCAAAASVAVVVLLVASPLTPWATVAAWRGTAPGVPLFTSPLLAAVTFCLVRTLGEALWPRPAGTVRRAPLVRRTAPDLGGWRLVVLLGTVAAGLLVVVAFGVTAEPDGRSVAHPPYLDGSGGLVTGASGPYPGWAYGVPVAVALLAALVAALVALRAVTRRAPLALLPAEHDDAVRRTSAARVLAGAQLWTGLAIGGMALVAGVSLRSADHPLASLASGLLGAACALGSVCVAATALPGRRARDRHRRLAADVTA